MRTGAEGYAEVQAMKPVNVLAVMDRCRQDSHCRCASKCTDCPIRAFELEIGRARAAMADLIDEARRIYDSGLVNVTDFERLERILERIA